MQRLVHEASASLETALSESASLSTLARLAQDLGGTDLFAGMVSRLMEPTMALVAAYERDVARTAGRYQGLQRYAVVPPDVFAPAVETAT